jgi:hypothetical protein
MHSSKHSEHPTGDISDSELSRTVTIIDDDIPYDTGVRLAIPQARTGFRNQAHDLE